MEHSGKTATFDDMVEQALQPGLEEYFESDHVKQCIIQDMKLSETAILAVVLSDLVRTVKNKLQRVDRPDFQTRLKLMERMNVK